MGQLRRGNLVMVWWKGDHSPRHVHVYRDGKFVVKWDLDNDVAMKGRADGRVRKVIRDLVAEGVL